MVTTVANPGSSARRVPVLPGRRFDNFFFSGMALLMLATVFIGFAPSYYLAGVFHAPLPSRIIHIHGAVFSCWILLLVAQTSLVSAGRVDIHRRLGIAGFLLACLMVVVGTLAATDSLVRNSNPTGRDAQFFYIVPMTDLLIFGVLIFFAFRYRSNAPTHKRLVLVATVALMIAPIARWQLSFVRHNILAAMLTSYVFLLLIIAYDLWSTRKIHRATLIAGIFLVFIGQVRMPIGQTAVWHYIASRIQSLAS